MYTANPAASLLLTGLLASNAPIAVGGDDASRFAVYYAADAELDALEPYELLVLDADHHPDLGALASRGKTLLGYLSLGEVSSQRAHFHAVQADGILLEENRNWPGSFLVDVRSEAWKTRVCRELAPSILDRGFDGLFLDTLDNPSYLERSHPERYRGMSHAAVELVLELRRHFPDALLMMNRAYELLPRLASDIDFVLGESVRADYDFGTKRYFLVDQAIYQSQVERLQAAVAMAPALEVFTLDYWDPDDFVGIASIYEQQRANGFEPYVATVELDRIVPEPEKQK
jgi:uncharacterized protein (TIGR01370 family)